MVALVTKFADLLLTYELTWDAPTWRTRAAQVWMSLRFSWHEFAIVTALLTIVFIWQRRVREPGRKTRVALGVLRAALIMGALVSAAGIKYYGLYQGHLMVTDFVENLAWAIQVARSINVLGAPATQLGAVLGALLLFGLPRLCARARPRAAARLGAIAIAIAGTMSVVTWASGRPRLTEAQLEPNPVVWFFWGPHATYFHPPPIETLAPIGPRQRLYSVTERPRNVILVVLESVPAHSIAGYGPSASAGRRLVDTYGDEITTFEQIFADVPVSDSTILGLLTGLSPIPTNRKALEATRGRPTLAEILRSRGYHNEFLLTGPRNTMIADLVDRGFDRALYMQSVWPNDEKYVRLTWGPDDRALFDYVGTFLDAQRADSPPFFLVMYTSNAHYPYESASIPGLRGDPDSRVRHAQLTSHVMELLTNMYGRLKEKSLADSTAVLAFGDHGQAFGEHKGNFVHSKELYWENLHVPMLLLHPTRLGLPPRISQLGALVDVMPTVLDILGIEARPGSGMSLLESAPDRLLFQMTPFGPGVAGFRSARYFYALSRTGRELLFDRVADPLEQHNIRDERPDIAASFRARLSGRPLPGALLSGGSTTVPAAAR